MEGLFRSGPNAPLAVGGYYYGDELLPSLGWLLLLFQRAETDPAPPSTG